MIDPQAQLNKRLNYASQLLKNEIERSEELNFDPFANDYEIHLRNFGETWAYYKIMATKGVVYLRRHFEEKKMQQSNQDAWLFVLPRFENRVLKGLEAKQRGKAN